MDQLPQNPKTFSRSIFSRWFFWVAALGLSQLALALLFFQLKTSQEWRGVLVQDLSASPGYMEATVPSFLVSYQLPTDFTLFGEPVPMQRPDIQERLDQEMLITLYRHSSTLLAFKRTPRVFAQIVPILKEEGLPEDFKYLAIAESNLGPAISPAGAAGVWQIMPETATQFGLEVNERVDERFHLEKSTRVACRYLKDAQRQLASWLSAAAAYNMGTNGFKKQTEEQKTTDYFQLRLNSETARYIFRIAAIKMIWTQPESFGYGSALQQPYSQIPVRKVAMNEAVDWVDWAIQNQTSYYLLRELNPWIRDRKFSPLANKSYEVLLPAQ
jgi:hypothetical protein